MSHSIIRILAVVAGGALFHLAGGAQDGSYLILALRDGASGRSIPGLVQVLDTDGNPVPLKGLVSQSQSPSRPPAWHGLPDTTAVPIPPGRYTIEGFAGLTTHQATMTVSVDQGEWERATLTVNPTSDPRSNGWAAGNTHLHLKDLTRDQADHYLRVIPRVNHLDVVFLSHLEGPGYEVFYSTNSFSAADLRTLSTTGVHFGNGEEHRHQNRPSFGDLDGYGHVMLLNIANIIRPVTIGPDVPFFPTDGRPLQRGIDAARAQGGTVIWCHNTLGFEDIPNWMTGRLHAQNIFDGPSRGTYEDTFYRYLNAGLRVPFSTGTDWSMYDLSRVYVRPEPGTDPIQAWLGGLRAGRSWITNGPLLEFTINGREIGETIPLIEPTTVDVQARARGRVDFLHLELVQNGRVVHTAPAKTASGGFEADLRTGLRIDDSSWLAVRVAAPGQRSELRRALFAHTSPIYVLVGKRPVFDPAAARNLLDETTRDYATVREKGFFRSKKERTDVLRVYEEGIAVLENALAAGRFDEPERR